MAVLTWRVPSPKSPPKASKAASSTDKAVACWPRRDGERLTAKPSHQSYYERQWREGRPRPLQGMEGGVQCLDVSSSRNEQWINPILASRRREREMGDVHQDHGYYKAHVVWNAHVGVVEVHVHNPINIEVTSRFSLEAMFPATFTELETFTPSHNRWYVAPGYLRAMAQVEDAQQRYQWHKDRLAPYVERPAPRRIAGARRLMELIGERADEWMPGDRSVKEVLEGDFQDITFDAGGYEAMARWIAEAQALPQNCFDDINRAFFELQRPQ